MRLVKHIRGTASSTLTFCSNVSFDMANGCVELRRAQAKLKFCACINWKFIIISRISSSPSHFLMTMVTSYARRRGVAWKHNNMVHHLAVLHHACVAVVVELTSQLMVGCVGELVAHTQRGGRPASELAAGACAWHTGLRAARGWHIMRHIWGRESSQNDVGAASATTTAAVVGCGSRRSRL